jgi:coenzyme F420-reducing hydrogenase beta subunit
MFFAKGDKAMSFFQFVPKNYVPRTAAKCTECQRLLPVDNFYARDDRPVWTRAHWSSRCKACMRAAARARYQADPKAAAAARRRNWSAKKAREVWRRHMDPVYLSEMDAATEARRIRRLTKTFHHSLWLHQHPYPKGYPHSYSARAAIERIKRAGQKA